MKKIEKKKLFYNNYMYYFGEILIDAFIFYFYLPVPKTYVSWRQLAPLFGELKDWTVRDLVNLESNWH